MTKKQTEEEFIDRGLCYTETTMDCTIENISWIIGTLIPNPYKVYMMVNCSILICWIFTEIGFSWFFYIY